MLLQQITCVYNKTTCVTLKHTPMMARWQPRTFRRATSVKLGYGRGMKASSSTVVQLCTSRCQLVGVRAVHIGV